MKPIDALLPNSSVPSRDKAETSGNLLLKKQSNQSEEVVSEGISDAECVRRIHEGEIAAFEVLVRRHQKTIFNLLYRMLGDYDEAAEISQEAFLSAYRSIGQFRGDANFSTWLYRIALNHASTRRRTVSERDIDPAENVEQKEIQEQVQRALKGLEPDDAAIILLKDLQDVSYEEVARVLAVPVGTVKSRLHRARRALKARLAPYFNARGTRK